MTNRRPTWTLQKLEGSGWADLASETSIAAIRSRRAEHAKADPTGIYRTVRSDENPTTKES